MVVDPGGSQEVAWSLKEVIGGVVLVLVSLFSWMSRRVIGQQDDKIKAIEKAIKDHDEKLELFPKKPEMDASLKAAISPVLDILKRIEADMVKTEKRVEKVEDRDYQRLVRRATDHPQSGADQI